MDFNVLSQLNNGLQTAFVNAQGESNLAYKPQFLANDYRSGQKLLSTLDEELLSCDEFAISVAFINKGGITPLLQTLKELEKKDIKGRILTTDYLTFSDPEALDTLNSLNNVELRLYCTDESVGFHTKGYIFKKEELFHIIIGSSNMTQRALTVNHEWNTKIISSNQGEMAASITKEFEALWNSEATKPYDDVADDYRVKYEVVKKQRKIASQGQLVSLEAYKLKPNAMQVGFIKNLQKLCDEGNDRGLLISATGTGKTYASAFGVRDVLLPEDSNKRVLFVVHREQIAKQAKDTFSKVFGNSKKYGLLSGNSKDYGSQFLFSTMQMMAKDETLQKYKQDEFSCIILDEAHRTGADSYKKIMNYFKPDFWLGMTASPERTDDFDVFKLFNHNIAYEIRLQQAMEEDLLCPFHYFGITDLEVDGVPFDEETGLKNFKYLVCDDRVNYIIDQAKYYGYSGDRVKGLIFCSSRKEAEELSNKFNEKGYRTVFLSGDSSQEKREEMMDRLTSDSRLDYLDYIFTVDIFNEGVDIPEINQVIMLRPTQSPIVFVQQLGRGLRKATDKEYVVVLDFIGNYKNNFMIPIALSGDRTYNKDNVRRYVMEGTRVIPGSSTIHFDEISRKRIYSAIDAANFSDIKLIKENYKNLKYKLGRIPSLMDFDNYGEMDVLRIFDNNNLGSYYMFLKKYEPEYKVRLSEKEEKVIEFISKKIANGKRVQELEFLERTLFYKDGLIRGLKETMLSKYQTSLSPSAEKNIVNVFTNEFPSGSGKTRYKDCVFIKKDGSDYSISESYSKMLRNKDFYLMVQELIEFGKHRYNRDYSKKYQDTDLVLYQKYTYEDACRLLCWEHNEVAQNIGGYKYNEKTKTFPVFINYKKDGAHATINYKDRLESPEKLIAISKNNRKISSKDVQTFLHAKELGISVDIFIRKNKDDKISKEFYYLGRATASGKYNQFIMPETTVPAVEIEWILDTPIRKDIYEYITN